ELKAHSLGSASSGNGSTSGCTSSSRASVASTGSLDIGRNADSAASTASSSLASSSSTIFLGTRAAAAAAAAASSGRIGVSAAAAGNTGGVCSAFVGAACPDAAGSGDGTAGGASAPATV